MKAEAMLSDVSPGGMALGGGELAAPQPRPAASQPATAHQGPPTPFVHPEFLAIAGDDASLNLLRLYARDRHWPPTTVFKGDWQNLAGAALKPSVPQLLVLDIDGAPAPAAIVAEIAGVVGRHTRIVALGSANDVRLYRELLSAGAVDYLMKPLTPEAIRALDTAGLEGRGALPEAKGGDGKLIVVVGVRGGVGATTLAVNAAWSVAHDLKQNTALVDLDLQFGTAALSLDLEPGRGLREALAAPDRLDGLMLSSSMVAAAERLCVLAAEEPVEDRLDIDPSGMPTLLRELRRSFDVVAAELPRQFISTHRQVLASADAIVLVADLSLVGIRDTVRMREALAGSQAKLLVVAGRVGASRKGQIDTATFEKGISGKLAGLVPEDAKNASLAANQGKPLVAIDRNGPAALAIARLMHTLVSTAAPPSRGLAERLGLSRLFGGRQ